MKQKQYDAFISYSASDATEVEKIARALGDTALDVWFDRWSLVPGQAWQNQIEEAVSNSVAIIICFGSSGMRPHQSVEYRTVLDRLKAEEIKTVIPILLPGFADDKLPSPLNLLSLVDLRNMDKYINEMARVILAIEAALNDIGDVLRGRGDLDGALRCFERALAIDERALGPDHPTVANRLNNLGGVLRDRGDLDGALRCFERALAIDKRALGPDHPTVANRLNNIATTLSDLGRRDEALAIAIRATDLYRRLTETQPENIRPHLANALSNLAVILNAIGKSEKALEAAKEATDAFYELTKTHSGAYHADLATSLSPLYAPGAVGVC